MLLQTISEKEGRTVWVIRNGFMSLFRVTREMGISTRHCFTSNILPTALHLPHTSLIHTLRLIYKTLSPWKVYFLLSKEPLDTQLSNADIAWIALELYFLTQLTMLTKAKQMKKCTMFRLRTSIIISLCHGSAALLLFIHPRIVVTEQCY